MEERQVVSGLFLVAHQYFAEPVKPRMASFHNPSMGSIFWVFDFGGNLLADGFNMGRIVSFKHDFVCFSPRISFVRAKVLRRLIGNGRPFYDHRVQYFFQLSDIMKIGPGHDERERDATFFHQQISFASFFSPDPLDCVQPPLAPGGLCSLRRQCFANARKYLPSHHIRPNRLAIVSEIRRLFPSVESTSGLSWGCQNVLWARPSTGTLYAAHKQSPRRCAGHPLVYARPRPCAHISFRDHVPDGVKKVLLAPKKHRRLPMIEFSTFLPP